MASFPPRENGSVASTSMSELTWNNWNVDLSWAGNCTLTSSEVSRLIGDSAMEMTKVYVDSYHGGMRRGMDAFVNNAQWYKPETDIKIIAERLGKSENLLRTYTHSKQCYQQSYKYSITDTRCFTIHGWATDFEFPLSLPHACLCAVLNDGLFVFDLVRDTPLLIYGVPVSREFMDGIQDIGSHGGLYAIDTMNYLNQQSNYETNPDNLQELLDILRQK